MRRIVLVVTFMAVLELIKMQEILFRQETHFGAIFVKRRQEKDREAEAQESKPETEQELPQK
jgi:chromatin segregation and condensation protein Rec8/ScpA/Scc1 (kleisin family)